MSDTDGVDEITEQGFRMAVVAAARLGEALMRSRQEAMQRAAEESAARAQELQERFNAEMLAARNTYRGVDEPQWWEKATTKDIAEVYETAAAWRDVDAEAARVQAKIEAEILERYGVDVNDPPGAESSAENDPAVQEREQEARDLEAAALVTAADRADAAAEGPEWDSRERREHTARELGETVTDARAVEAKLLADVAQAKPASDAVKVAATRARKRRALGSSGSRQRDRGSRGR